MIVLPFASTGTVVSSPWMRSAVITCARIKVTSGASVAAQAPTQSASVDTSISTIRALPEVVDAVQGRLEILLDGGVRRGTDVIKAIALGARAVLVGRPVVWGLAADGEQGARRVLELLRAEIDLAMALCGCPTVSDITRDLVA